MNFSKVKIIFFHILIQFLHVAYPYLTHVAGGRARQRECNACVNGYNDIIDADI